MIKRSALLPSLVFASVLGAGACSSSTPTFTLPTGAVAVTGYGTCSQVNTYVAESALFCRGTQLSCGSTWYVLCDGTDFVACSCSVPSGFTPATGYQISAESSCSGSNCTSVDGGRDGGSREGGSADAGHCAPPGTTAPASDAFGCCGNSTVQVPVPGTSKVTCFSGVGGACTAAADCSSGVCTKGHCKTSGLGGHCLVSDDCYDGKEDIYCNEKKHLCETISSLVGDGGSGATDSGTPDAPANDAGGGPG
jgi:hypothetical protein